MERKQFLKSTSLLLGAAFVDKKSLATPSKQKTVIPPYLKPGDTIGVTSPSGSITLEEIEPAVTLMKSWDFQIETGRTIGKKDGTFGGTDAERITDFQYMLNNPRIKAIMCARGGYGVVRIIDQIDFSHLRKEPKWIIGFSDITVFHSHILTNYKVATIHSKMCNSFPNEWATAEPLRQDTILSIQRALLGQAMQYSAPPNPSNRFGSAKGQLIGGNLRSLENLAGTDSEMDTKGKILFLEEVDEPLYNIDRMFWNLKRTGRLDNIAGLIIGGFKIKPDEPGDDKFSLNLEQIVLEKVEGTDYPICFDFPVGHQINNFALKCGCEHLLNVTQSGTTLSEQNT
ncbi:MULTISPECIES: S66 peptidase family protein [Chitinophagaceae]